MEAISILIIISTAIIVGMFFFMFIYFRRQIGWKQLELLSVIISTKDGYIHDHQTHVASLVDLFYEHLPSNIKKKINRKKLNKAALCHDIGKVLIPDTILFKKDKLTPEEYEVIKTHPAIGAGIIDMTACKNISTAVLCHHEKWNGEGYPLQLVGDQIPIESQIISICDVFSACSNSRSYREPMDINKARGIIQEAAGKQFSQELVDVFMSIDTQKLVAVNTLLKHNAIRSA